MNSDVDKMYEVKLILMHAREREEKRYGYWERIRSGPFFANLIIEASNLCDLIGYTNRNNWKKMKPSEQEEVARILFTPSRLKQVMQSLNYNSFQKTNIPAIDNYLNLDKLQIIYKTYPKYPGASLNLLTDIAPVLEEDWKITEKLDAVFPQNGNPDLLTKTQLGQMYVWHFLSPEEFQKVKDFAEQHKIYLDTKPQHVVTQIDGRAKLQPDNSKAGGYSH